MESGASIKNQGRNFRHHDMIINGIDFDKRLDRLKEITYSHIDCLFDLQRILSSEPKFNSPLDILAQAAACAAVLENFKMKINSVSGANFTPTGMVHRGELIVKP